MDFIICVCNLQINKKQEIKPKINMYVVAYAKNRYINKIVPK